MATVIDGIVDAATMPAETPAKRDAAVAAMLATLRISPVGFGSITDTRYILRSEGYDAVIVDHQGNIFDVVPRARQAA